MQKNSIVLKSLYTDFKAKFAGITLKYGSC